MPYTNEEINDLEKYCNAHAKNIQGPIKLGAGEIIIDVEKFIEAQASCIRTQLNSPAVDPHYQRLKKLKAIFETGAL